MAPIDPCELLKAFRPLLTCNGGIKNSEEVPRLAGLMRKFSKKLVSRCTYCNILLATDNDVLESFLANDGWNIVNTWLKDAKSDSNDALLTELLKLLDMCPMSVDRLKENDTAKLVKTLSKWDDDLIAEKSRAIVNKWMIIIKEGNEQKLIEENAKKKRKKELERSQSVEDTNETRIKKQKRSNSESENEDMQLDTPPPPDSIEYAMHSLEKQLCEANDARKPIANNIPKENGVAFNASVNNNMKLESRAPTAKIRYGKSRSIGFDEVLSTTKTVEKSGDKTKSNVPPSVNSSGDVLLNKTLKVNETVKTDTNDSKTSRVILIDPKPLTPNSLNNKVCHTIKESASFVDAIMNNSERSQPRKKRRLSGLQSSVSSQKTDDSASDKDATLDEKAEDDECATADEEEEMNTDEEIPAELSEVEKQIEAELRGKELTEAVDYNDYNYEEQEQYEDSPVFSMEDDSQSKSSSVKSPSQIKSILCYSRKIGQKKKSVRWVSDEKIKEVRFFELDENERMNVSRTFGEYRILEMKNERQALMCAKNGFPVSPEKAPIEHFPWQCIYIDFPEEVVLHEKGKQSNEKIVQEERHKNILHEFYPLKELAPDFPQEPDAFEALAGSHEAPVTIPLEDESNPQVCDFSQLELPKPVTDELPLRSPTTQFPPFVGAPTMMPMAGVFGAPPMQQVYNPLAPGVGMVPAMAFSQPQPPIPPQQPSYNTYGIPSQPPLPPHRSLPPFPRRPFNKDRRDRPPRNEKRVCKFFAKHGRCKFQNCNFVHQNPNVSQNNNDRSNRTINRNNHNDNNNLGSSQQQMNKSDDWNSWDTPRDSWDNSVADTQQTQPIQTTSATNYDDGWN
ncbi:serine/threonine-protein phosphatase 1 regulatory subunit 10-like protein [Leptotrombidium deliense]|uniref:Serine/threonine-protein phosphatase 1 regulatory subunit 10 n=1 Tax=Leptotrombidium deliense TaxID=299467 RepID=A0A443SK06_9ACAR|nr:serine/threonine-protein phosphatase 1 regulatory subunit 10-like protein [Leptotrombidium deliense]